MLGYYIDKTHKDAPNAMHVHTPTKYGHYLADCVDGSSITLDFETDSVFGLDPATKKEYIEVVKQLTDKIYCRNFKT